MLVCNILYLDPFTPLRACDFLSHQTALSCRLLFFLFHPGICYGRPGPAFISYFLPFDCSSTLLSFPLFFFYPRPVSPCESSCQSPHSASRFLRLRDWFGALQLPLMCLLLIKPHFPPLERPPKHKHGRMRDGRRVQMRQNNELQK